MTCWAKLISFSKYFSSTDSCDNSIVDTRISLVDTGRKLKVHKTFRRRPGRLLDVLCTFNLSPVSKGYIVSYIPELLVIFMSSQLFCILLFRIVVHFT